MDAPGSATVTRVVHVVSLLAVIAVPVIGYFAQGWSGATTLVVYWFETVAMCLFVWARIVVHSRWTPRRGHFGYDSPNQTTRGGKRLGFATGFAVTSLSFCAAHGFFLAVIIFLLRHNGKGDLVDIDWRSAGFGCLSVFGFLAVSFLTDLLTLRRWSFWQLEQTANRGLGRVMVVHLTLLIGFVGIAVTGAANTLFSVFVVLKTLAALSYVTPQYQPAKPPKWLSAIMNRAPNLQPGESFEEFWADERERESERRVNNEQPVTRQRLRRRGTSR